MKKYRITKYNPTLRNEDGWYMSDDWIDWSDIEKYTTETFWMPVSIKR